MLQLLILTGKLQGTLLDIFEGFKIGFSKNCDLQINTDYFKNNSFIVKSNSSGILTLYSSNKKHLISSGSENLPKIDLIPGLIFSINEIGFSTQEAPIKAKIEEEKKLLSLANLYSNPTSNSSPKTPKINILQTPIAFNFTRGFWLNQSWNIPWQPISFGKASNLFFFIDESITSDLDFLDLFTSNNELVISSKIPNFVSCNKKLINEPKKISDGDLIEFGQTAFYIKMK